jgi:magnesium transporter
VVTCFRYADGRIESLPSLSRDELFGSQGAQFWVDLEDPTPDEQRLLEEVFRMHPLAIEDTLAELHHPKVDDYEDHLFVIVHGVRFDVPSDRLVTRKLSIALGRNFLVTHHLGPMRSIETAREQCVRNVNAALPRGVDFMLHLILDLLFEQYSPALEAIQDKIQLIEVEVFEQPTRETLSRIFALKREVMDVRRICGPQREIAQRLSRGEFAVIGRKAGVYFRDIYDDLYRLVDLSFFYQDMVQATLDAYLTAVSNRLNETMKRLTVIGAILMPLTLITGIYGMNFQHMPELGLRYGYFTVLALMLALSAGLLWLFKRKGWI